MRAIQSSILKRFFKRLKAENGGNAVMLVALGLPVLIGGSGFAVDTAQWYMWKRELQYAVDQAAIAGAWARTKDETEDSYVARAQQEYGGNLEETSDFATAKSDVSVSLANFAKGTLNSVVVSASATKTLPFSFFLTGKGVTINVSAQASFEKGRMIPSCLVAVSEHDSGAVTIGGSAEFIAGCGIKALSDAGKDALHPGEAITVDGNPTIKAGTLLATGAISDWFNDTTNDHNIDNDPIPFADGLTDQFADLVPPTPNPNVNRSADCPKGKTTTSYIADQVQTRTQVTYQYYTASGNGSKLTYTLTSYTGAAKHSDVDDTTTDTNVTLTALPTSNTVVTGPTDSGYVQVDGSKKSPPIIYEKSTKTVTTTYTNPHASTDTTGGGALVLQPGTYSDMTIKCDTVFTPGIYVLDGSSASLTIHSQYNVTGSGVMFVLKNGAGIDINGGSSVNLTAMTVTELEAAGVSEEQAEKLDGMLIFEDRNSPGNSGDKINGNSSTILNGTVYLPVSNLDIKGSAGVTSQCLLLVASTISISGNVEMDSFCPPNLTETDQSTYLQGKVRLVS